MLQQAGMQYKEPIETQDDAVCVEELELGEGELVRIVGAELRGHTLVSQDGIELSVDEGVVTLSGYVRDLDQRTEAMHAVEHVPGVRTVRNELKVVALRVSPGTLRGAVEAALARHAIREADKLAFEIVGRMVTVSGEIESDAERRAVLGAVGSMRGVERVIDQMRSSNQPAGGASAS